MTIKTAMAALVLGTILLSCAAAQQGAFQTVSDRDLQLLRKDLQSEKKQIIAANLLLTTVEAQNFWPVYDQYAAELAKINDIKVSVVKDYAANFEKLSDNQASTLVKRWAEADQSTTQLRMKYLPMFQKVMSGKKAALFFQIDRRVGVLIDLQMGAEIPLVQPN